MVKGSSLSEGCVECVDSIPSPILFGESTTLSSHRRSKQVRVSVDAASLNSHKQPKQPDQHDTKHDAKICAMVKLYGFPTGPWWMVINPWTWGFVDSLLAFFFRASMKWDDHKQEKPFISDMIISLYPNCIPPKKCLKHPQNWNQSDWFREHLDQKTIKFSLKPSNWCNVAGGPWWCHGGAMVVPRCLRCLGPGPNLDCCRAPRGDRGPDPLLGAQKLLRANPGNHS